MDIKVVEPKNRSLEKKVSHDFKTWNDIMSRELWKRKLYFLWKKFKTHEK